MADEKPDAGMGVTAQELHVAFAPPAPISNRVLLTMLPAGGRLSFLEVGPDGLPQFRAAVFMGLDGLVSLHELIGKMLTPMPEGNADVPKG